MHDIRIAARSLLKTPGLTAAAILIVALGSGAAVAMFSVAYGVLLRPLPYRDSSSLAVIAAERTFGGRVRPANYSAIELDGWSRRAHAFDAIALWGGTGYTLRTEAGLEPIHGAYVSPTFFSTLDEPLALGRAIGPADDTAAVVVVSHRIWTARLGADPDVLGRSVALDGHPYTVIGVARESFQFPSTRTDVWTPVGFARALGAAPWIGYPRGGGFMFVARMRPGVTRAAAQSDADAVARSLAAYYPEMSSGRRPLVVPLNEWVAGSVRDAMLMLSVGVFLILLATYANVINLLLARQAAREQERAVRVALGAGRMRLLGYSIAEATLIVGSGAGAGLLVSFATVSALVWLHPPWLPRIEDVGIDTPVLLFAVLLACASIGLCGLVPALLQGRNDPGAVLRSAAPGLTGTSPARWVQSALVIAEVAGSVVLLVISVLLGRSLYRLLTTDVGVVAGHVIVAQLDLASGRELAAHDRTAVVEHLVERLIALPQVERVGVGTSLPPDLPMRRFTLKQVDTQTGERRDFDVDALAVTPGFFTTLGVPLVSGRLFAVGDTAEAPPVMIMSVETARRFFGDRSPIGLALDLPSGIDPSGQQHVTVIGIVGNVKFEGLERPADGGIYRPFAQEPMSSIFMAARTTVDPRTLAAQVRREIVAVDRDITVLSIQPLDDAVSRATAQPRFRTALMGSMAAVAVLLACVGLYGIVAYSVSVRARELGIRMALGATPSRVVGMVLHHGLVLAGLGVAIGMAAAYAVTHLMAAFLYGIAPADPRSFASAAAMLLTSAALASYVSARRAARIDPVASLRAE